ncbi:MULTISPECIES: efflux RND transporter permease subunit [Elizabethkingia]|uniref:efflux RND transporter permease subunit n=1 Tax=Elizabethkingia TaxID=308865 RepID=UPI001A359D1F|nr:MULTISPECIES: efflux RND transporter permease subunit [Elizabethkingia]MCT3670212.1 efflux RND transporter permease subunit [Elizabethkingia anophelis]MCT3688242.1 efflux RND transporter permease subunit [Elizabethkingia anophelis]MCT3707171.1 efflux RND transporter permease subunit [Elizabethkingia anophelis]MCT3713630.1 efflux RND transporter permease subunit [Elizabethkingia anophelis]MCT3717049.1 efflux RND transporter permease subunit [Elizabethkingia anophelis]
MLKNIIKRPVLATVISILMVILGIVGMLNLPITKFPEIAPPTVMVTAVYPGANAETIARSVAPPIENAINGVENMDYITSTASNDGTLSITVIFKLGTNPDQAAVNVQNRVAQVTNQLPVEVVRAGITTIKRQNSMISMLALTSKDGKMDELFLENYAKINIIPELKRVKGVGDAMVWGNKDYSMRVWLDPEKLNSYGLAPIDISNAIQSQNIEAAPGKFGENSNEAMEYVMRYKGKYTEPEQYENIIIKAQNDGSILRLKDVAKVEFGAYSYGSSSKFDRKAGPMMAVFQMAGSNANEVQIAINEKMKQLEKSFPPGVEYRIPYATKESLDQSISQVISTLVEAFILVFIVVYIFLQDFRSTLIPAIAVPVSIIGTFFFMNLFGFSINILTLFALVLAIGIVVDDAIVVVEAVHAKMEHRKLNARAATMSAMHEISGAIVSITLVMSAVFVPVAFMKGSTGLFYQQFALTLAIAIIISAINALTLSPALTALFLKPHEGDQHEKKNFKDRFFAGFNAAFNAITNRYGKSILFLIKKRWIAFAIMAVFGGLFIWMSMTTPKGFIPDEDQNFLAITVNLPPGASKTRTIEVIKTAEHYLSGHTAVENVMTVDGFNMFSSTSSASAGAIWIKLKHLKDRGDVKKIDDIIGQFQAKLAEDKRANFLVLNMPTVDGFGNTSGMELVLQDRTNGELQKLGQVSYEMMGALMQRPEIAVAFTTFDVSFPQFELLVDEAKAAQLGVSLADVMGVMQGYYGSIQSSDFNRFGKYYRVQIQSAFDARKDQRSLDGVFVKNNTGGMVPINTLVTLKPTTGAEIVDRFNLFNASNLTVMAKPGYSTGQAMKAVEEVSEKLLPQGYTYDYKGMSREEAQSGSQSALIFGLCIVFVYFLLSAQYDSYILPLSVLLAIPVGLSGVFIGITFADISNNIYVQIAMVMLIGLLAKNGILIVEFAIQRRRVGKSLVAAAVEGAKARLRPILMTSIAFIAGLTPLLFVVGPSALGNHSIGYAAIFGMLFGTVLGVFITPVLFVIFQYLHERVSGKQISEADWEYN